MVQKSLVSRVFYWVNVSVLILVTAITLYPFLNVLAVSMSNYMEYVKDPLMFYPRNFDFSAYEKILKNPLLISSYKNTIFVTVVGTAINMFLTVLTAYPLSKDYLRGNKWFMLFIIFTMMFSGGLIPSYYLVKRLGLINSLWALILPGAVSAYNLVLMKNFLKTIPESLEESAKIDGATDLTVLSRIILPLSMPAIAAISLFYAVGNWNIFFSAIMYTTERSKWTLQLLLREIVMESNQQVSNMGGDSAETGANVYPQTMKTATIIATVLPILLLYPFLQKYFVKGIMLGAVKQ